MMSGYRSIRRLTAMGIAAALAVGLTACVPGTISEDRMVEVRQPLADTFREAMVALGVEVESDQEFLVKTSWCRDLDDPSTEPGRLTIHGFAERLQIDNTRSLTGAEIEAIATDIIESNGFTVEKVVEDGPSSHRTMVEGRIFDNPQGESIAEIVVYYRGDPNDIVPYITVQAETACARGDELIDTSE